MPGGLQGILTNWEVEKTVWDRVLGAKGRGMKVSADRRDWTGSSCWAEQALQSSVYLAEMPSTRRESSRLIPCAGRPEQHASPHHRARSQPPERARAL